MERNIIQRPSSRIHPSALLIKVLVSEMSTSPQSFQSSTALASLAENLSDSSLALKPHGLSSHGRSSIRSIEGCDEICAICKEEVKLLSSLLPCAHMFHADCLEEWFQGHSTCPICRKNIDYY